MTPPPIIQHKTEPQKSSSTLINCHIKCTRIYIYDMEKWRRDTPSSDYRFDDVTFLFPTKTRRKETCRRSSCYYKYCTVTGGDGASDNWAGIEKAHDRARWDFFFFFFFAEPHPKTTLLDDAGWKCFYSHCVLVLSRSILSKQKGGYGPCVFIYPAMLQTES